jgi:hypothetical protein
MFTRLKPKEEGSISMPRYGHIRVTDEVRHKSRRLG